MRCCVATCMCAVWVYLCVTPSVTCNSIITQCKPQNWFHIVHAPGSTYTNSQTKNRNNSCSQHRSLKFACVLGWLRIRCALIQIERFLCEVDQRIGHVRFILAKMTLVVPIGNSKSVGGGGRDREEEARNAERNIAGWCCACGSREGI